LWFALIGVELISHQKLAKSAIHKKKQKIFKLKIWPVNVTGSSESVFGFASDANYVLTVKTVSGAVEGD